MCRGLSFSAPSGVNCTYLEESREGEVECLWSPWVDRTMGSTCRTAPCPPSMKRGRYPRKRIWNRTGLTLAPWELEFWSNVSWLHFLPLGDYLDLIYSAASWEVSFYSFVLMVLSGMGMLVVTDFTAYCLQDVRLIFSGAVPLGFIFGGAPSTLGTFQRLAAGLGIGVTTWHILHRVLTLTFGRMMTLAFRFVYSEVSQWLGLLQGPNRYR